jgi:transposase
MNALARLTKPQLIDKVENLEAKVMEFSFQLEQLRKMVYGSRHERFVPTDPGQLTLGLDVGITVPEPVTQKVTYERQKTAQPVSPPSRMPLPSTLPRQEILLEPLEDLTGMKKIGEEITEQLDYRPGSLFVKRFIRPKYARKGCEGIVVASLPDRPIEKGIPGAGLLAHILIDKFTDHLPIYRQVERFTREGIPLSTSTLSDWITQSCALLKPLAEVQQREVLSSSYLGLDETPIKVLDKEKKGTTHRGYHWVYYSVEKKLVWFDYQPSRGREGPRQHLAGFKGFLQTDGYSVYDEFGKEKDIHLLGCMAHARRKFMEARDNDRERAEQSLERIQKLYELEREWKGKPVEEITTLRRERALPILEEWKDWMVENYPDVPPKSLIGGAISYSLSRWDKLARYTEEGRLQIDNNLVENAIRPVALGRKNYLFAGSHEGARRAAMIYSFLGSCKKNGINPFEWMRDVLERLPSHKANKLHELLPNNWKENQLQNNSQLIQV